MPLERPQEILVEIPIENLGVFLLENLDYDMLIEEIEIPCHIKERLKEPHRRDLSLRRQNVEDLKTIQRVISVEEEQHLTLDEVLDRVLSFYRRFVPYK